MYRIQYRMYLRKYSWRVFMGKYDSSRLGKTKGGFSGGLKEKPKKISGMAQIGKSMKSDGGYQSKKGWKPNVRV